MKICKSLKGKPQYIFNKVPEEETFKNGGRKLFAGRIGKNFLELKMIQVFTLKKHSESQGKVTSTILGTSC